MSGVEAEGIDFILRFRDAASDQIQIAEQSYRRLVSSMQEVIATHRAFGNSIVETMGLVQKQMTKGGGVPLVTPLTMNEGQIGLMDQFQLAAASWFQQIAAHFARYSSRAQASTQSTEALRGSISGLIGDFQGYGASIRQIFPLLEQFTRMKFGGLQSDPLRRIMIDLKGIVKAFLDMVKVSPEFQKQMKETNKDLGNLADTTGRLAKETQKTNFHGIDNEAIMERQRKKAVDANKSFDSLLKTMGNLSQVKWVLGAAGFGIATNQFIQKFSSLEDAAMAVRVRIGDMGGSIDDLVGKFVKLGKESKHSALETGSAFAMIAQKAGRITEATNALTVTTMHFSKLAQVAPEYAGQIAGTLVGALKLTERQSESLLKMALKAQQGAKNMTATEFLTPMTDNIDMFIRAADAAGQSVDVFVQRNAAGMMAMQKALSNVYGDATQATRMMAALSSAVSDDSKQMMAMSAWGRENYFQMRQMMAEGRMEDVYATMITAAKKMYQESGGMVNERIESFAQAIGMEAKDIRELSRMSTEDLKRFTSELKNTRAVDQQFQSLVKERKGTMTGMMESISADWENVIAKGGMLMKAFVYPLIHGFSKLLDLATSIPGVTEALVALTMAFGALSTLGSIRMLMGWVGMGGWITRLLSSGTQLASMGGVFGRLTNVMGGTAAAASQAGRAMSLGEVAATVTSGGILAKTWTWFKSIGTAAREATADILHLNRAPRQLSFNFEEPATGRISGLLNNIRERVTQMTRGHSAKISLDVAGGEAPQALRSSVSMLSKLKNTAVSMFSSTFPELSEMLGRTFGGVFGALEGRLASLGRLIPRVLSRVIGPASWGLLISDIIVWVDKLLAKLGPLGAIMRLILAPATRLAKVVGYIASELWKLVKSAWEGSDSMNVLAKGLHLVLAPIKMVAEALKWAWNKMEAFWQILRAVTPDINKLVDQMTDVEGLFRSWGGWLDRMEEKFNGSWVGKALAFIRGAGPKEDPRQLQQAQRQQVQAQQSVQDSNQLLYDRLKQKGVTVDRQDMSPEEWGRRLREAAKTSGEKATPAVQPPTATNPVEAPPTIESTPATVTTPSTSSTSENLFKQMIEANKPQPIVTPQVPQARVEPIRSSFPKPDAIPQQAKSVTEFPRTEAAPQQATLNEGQRPSLDSSGEKARTAALSVPKIDPPEVNVSVNPSPTDYEPEPSRPRLQPASFNPNQERDPSTRYLNDSQAGDDVPSLMAMMQNNRSKERPTVGPSDNSDVVRALQSIEGLIRVALQQARETKRLPQQPPAFRPQFSQLAEGSA